MYELVTWTAGGFWGRLRFGDEGEARAFGRLALTLGFSGYRVVVIE